MDANGHLDLALTGVSTENNLELLLYTNDGSNLSGDFLSLTGLESSDLAWGDYDRDGDPDLLASGIGSDGVKTTLYENDSGTFTEVTDLGLPGIKGGDLGWGDYDNDQDLDIVISGYDDEQPILHLYENTIGQ